MLSTKLTSFSKVTKYVITSNTFHVNSNFNSRNLSYTHLICRQLLKCKHPVTYNSCVECNYNKSIVTSPCLLKYSTKPIEVPPLPPPASPPESDIFGTLGGLNYEKVELDKDELKEEERLKTLGSRVPRKFKPSAGQYASIIKTHLTKGDLVAAEKVLYECRKNRDIPTPYMYTLMIRGFAMQGDVKNSYKYFSEMKTRHYKIKANTYTSLFNACANSGDSDKSLKYLEKVREHMVKNEVMLNHAHYNVLVKAYGRHNRYDVAMKIFQEMLDKKLKIGASTLNSLLYAANSNVESGLKDILHVWQLMRKLRVPPDLFSYNLLLRGIRDTHFGNCTIQELFLSDSVCPAIKTDDNRPDLLVYPPVISDLPLENIHREGSETLLLNAPKSESENNSDFSKSEDNNNTKATKEHTKTLTVSIQNLNLDAILKQNKLILFGGVDGLIEKIEMDKVQPNVKTITYLVELVPDSIIAEEKIVKYAKSKKIPLDIDFFNMLIKKRCVRGAHKDAKEVLNYIHKADLRPNIVTYGVLALACKTSSEINELLDSMKNTGHTINKYVADALLTNACYKKNFGSILKIMELIRTEMVRLDDSTFEKLDKFQQKMGELVKRKDPIIKTEKFKIGFAKFNLRYKTWQEDMGRLAMTEREYRQK